MRRRRWYGLNDESFSRLLVTKPRRCDRISISRFWTDDNSRARRIDVLVGGGSADRFSVLYIPMTKTGIDRL